MKFQQILILELILDHNFTIFEELTYLNISKVMYFMCGKPFFSFYLRSYIRPLHGPFQGIFKNFKCFTTYEMCYCQSP